LVIGVLAGLAGGEMLRVWPASAQPQVLPNAADQRNAMVAELKVTNGKLDAIHALLASGKVVVQVKEAGKPEPVGGGAKAVDR
jgi:hypothetical protein